MKPNLFIINNGLKDLRGHYFETSVSIAEASESMGLHPVLAAHVHCPSDIVPEGLDFHPAFTTDHWMMAPPPPHPDLTGLRGDPALLSANTIESLKGRKIGFNAYLNARFFPDIDRASHIPPEPTNPPKATLASAKALAKRVVRASLPPVVLKARPYLKPALRLAVPPILWKTAKVLSKGRNRPQPGCDDAIPATVVFIPTPLDRLRSTLEKRNLTHEFDYMNRFRIDLERIMFLAQCSPCDHVFLPTAHGRELAAILDMTSRWPAGSQPVFHLEFRHALVLDGQGMLSATDPYSQAHDAFFQFARAFPHSNRIRLYTDSEGLAREYQTVSGLEFGVLPIPFRSQFINVKARNREPIQIAYFGDVRDEKGFHWLPDLIDSMRDQYIQPGHVRFLIQASLVHPDQEPRSRQALERLKAMPREEVRLVGQDGPLTPAAYFQLVSEAGLLLCPYDPLIYHNRTSGTLTEAIAAGIPTVVPAASWLARQQPTGSGQTFSDLESFISGVKRICDDYARYRSHAQTGRHAWLSIHSPTALIRALLDDRREVRSQVGKVA